MFELESILLEIGVNRFKMHLICLVKTSVIWEYVRLEQKEDALMN